eukprot:CAMPEP_0185749254 /NCGR_PEP_ID=MMETSP1174-20130828/8002_1 /TAXON_ID=35687 /ORGANISM="Dictyocha speculum, Strain CCMP1381" /LENGTH=199 /DNA_ID=CAMNT_0028425305 /DNA_START=32 /DNA_END=631 /DNA_ORIENTATION=-
MPSVRAFSATTDTVPNSIDHGFEKNRIDKVANPDSREFTYLMLGGTRFVYASAVRLGVINFVSSMSASKDVLALASAEFNLSAIDVGQTVTVKWRGKPVFIKRRTPEEIATCEEVPLSALRDPEDDASRAERSEWLICLAICTHLGCVPISNAGEYGGWFCPCHGSHYDASGRIRKGPAPLNLEIPPYAFTSDDVVVLG